MANKGQALRDVPTPRWLARARLVFFSRGLFAPRVHRAHVHVGCLAVRGQPKSRNNRMRRILVRARSWGVRDAKRETHARAALRILLPRVRAWSVGRPPLSLPVSTNRRRRQQTSCNAFSNHPMDNTTQANYSSTTMIRAVVLAALVASAVAAPNKRARYDAVSE